jgi:chemotaxis protein CheC
VNNQKEIWNHLIDGHQSEHALRKVMWHVSRTLSDMVGKSISNEDPLIEKVPLSQVPARAGGAEAEMVGIYLVMGGGLRGQAILILPLTSALHLVDLLAGDQPGTATELGIMERSALAEIGNMTLASFLNAVSELADMPDLLRPSPPAVMVDMLGAILDVIITPVAAVRDDLLIIETTLRDARKSIQGRLWVLPDPAIQDLGRGIAKAMEQGSGSKGM